MPSAQKAELSPTPIAICSERAASGADIVVTTRTWGSFASIDIERQLQARGLTQVVIARVAPGTAVESTVPQACDAGFNGTLASDAMTGPGCSRLWRREHLPAARRNRNEPRDQLSNNKERVKCPGFSYFPISSAASFWQMPCPTSSAA
ncbi:isochorismatase family protein [Rhodoblastus sp.]|uniref:isochorismatase family protein n=1 Tax=Rhodoblastus sp. TaxID=1962975 RepID=UPI00260CB41A|nr:isochorismatase family protein [Rhodoblastus sp.]